MRIVCNPTSDNPREIKYVFRSKLIVKRAMGPAKVINIPNNPNARSEIPG